MYLIQYFKILFMFDYENGHLPVSFHNMWSTNATRRNLVNPNLQRNLRDDHLYSVPFVRLEQFMRFPLSTYPRIWNDFNQTVMAQTRNNFKTLLKEHLLSKLSLSVTCNRLLCPVCHLQVASI
jgi:hypothetical protein